MLPPFLPRLLAFDLDGTLLPDGTHELNEETEVVLQDFRAAGVKIAVITGRDGLSSALRKSISAHAYATSNGAEIMYSDGTSSHELLAESDVDYLLGHGLQGAQVVICGLAGYAVDTSCANVPTEWMEKWNCPPISPEHRKTAFMVRYKHAEAAAWAEQVRSVKPHLTVTGGFPPYPNEVAVTAREATKGIALRHIAGHFGVPMAQTVAFGDSDNDAPLLEAAAFGVQIGSHAHLDALADVRLAAPKDLLGYLQELLQDIHLLTSLQ